MIDCFYLSLIFHDPGFEVIRKQSTRVHLHATRSMQRSLGLFLTTNFPDKTVYNKMT